MQSGGACACRRSAGEQKMHRHPSNRPPCCCENRCTCPHCHGGPTPHPNSHSRFHHSGGKGDSAREEAVFHNGDLRSARRCTSCMPEQVELGKADFFARQQRCEKAREGEQLRRAALAESVGRRCVGGNRPLYASTFSEILRRRNNLHYQAAVDAEYDARRRELQVELDARRGEIAAMQRAHEERRMEAACCESEAARRCRQGSPPQRGSRRHSRSARHALPPHSHGQHNDPCPALPPALQHLKESEAPPANNSYSCGDRTPPPLRDHHHHRWGWQRGPCEQRVCDNRRPPSPWKHEERLPSYTDGDVPPSAAPHHPQPEHRTLPQHEADECPPPPPRRRACSPHHSPQLAGGAASACPSCGCPLMSACDIVSMIAAGKLDNSVACPSCGFIGGTLRCSASHRALPPRGPSSEGDDKRRRDRRGQCCRAWPRSHSADSSSSSPAFLIGPMFGRKVFITDDIYRDRRARYLAEWEARGAVRRVPPSSRSPSAPLPERTPKWRTTGSGCCAE
ncbi:hypothetical protein ABL78_1260 [Leptomonas seymouri]|uniref:Uncharacterized protein n=1 Tax=Leptomonas seymouri TaxID=5684 RepID=A0A0N1IM69_LEPSE|nr:hypothetical protein ABL78_1260 [Leptomonas seymouri]|eukprot:KPI89595.1 hypothetical protein ABL78_1260 [Leptomonas seymouri]